MLLCRLFALRPISLNNFVLDEASGGNQQIWAVDANVFGAKTSKNAKENNKIVAGPAHHSAVLRPVYILQPEDTVPSQGRGHKRYDRGRSFSPPKGRHAITSGRPHDNPHVSFGPNAGSLMSGSAPHSSTPSSLPRYFKHHEGFKKSFSTDTLYSNERLAGHEPYSMSSTSSTTSTGSNRSGNWHKDFKSGIPIPVSSEKIRIRTNISSSLTGPVIARRNVLGSPLETPVLVKSTTTITTNEGTVLPPRSSGSDSSGYFTPPDSQRAFVKLDTEERISETEEVANNNHVDCMDSYNANSTFPPVGSAKRVFSPSSAETSDGAAEEEATLHKGSSVESLENNNILPVPERSGSRFSSASLKHQGFSEITPINLDGNKNKSKSVAELQTKFLPEINNARKLSSAPPLNDEASSNQNNEDANANFEETNISPLKDVNTVLPGSTELLEENIEQSVETSESVTTVRLTRRFQRTQSRKSLRATPRQQKEPPPTVLRPYSKPKEALHHVLNQMESNEWETVVQGLQGLMRVVRNHPEVIETQMHHVCVTLSKHIKNLRSQVARVACKAASELFTSCKKGLLEMEFEEIAAPLLQRTADTNKFLRADANSALDVMCEHLPNSRVVTVVTSRGCLHQNAVVRAASVRILTEMVKKHGPDKILQLPKEVRDKILLAGANSLADGSQEARGHGKSMISLLKTHPGFHRALLEAVPQNVLRHITKSLNSIKAGA